MVDVFAGVVKLMKRDRAQHVREIAKLDEAIAALGGRTGTRAKRALSPEARKAIGDAQRKRWAKVRKNNAK